MKNQIFAQGDKFIEVQLGVLVFQEDNSYVAYCPALSLSTYGDSINDAKDAFEDLIKCYLEDAEKMGTLEKDLKAHGWELQMSMGQAKPPKEIELNIPAGMLKQQFNEAFRIPLHNC